MKSIKHKTAALAAAAAIAAPYACASARFTPSDGSDGFTLGYYHEDFSASDRAETEKLYAERPVESRRMEALTRGLAAVPGDGGTLVSWRWLGTDSSSLKYNLYRNGEKLNQAPLGTTNYFDAGAPKGAEYTLREVEDGRETGEKSTVTAWEREYISIPVTKHEEGYNIDDAAVADLDGDGEYEFILRRTPLDMAPATRKVYPLIEAYDTDGTPMWTINVGPNEINEVDINIMAYDFDGDGKSEVIMRSFEGTTDGTGNTVGDTNNDGITDYSKNESNLAIFTDRQYVVSTPEFLSVYDGETGAETDRTELLPVKEPLESWSYRYTDEGRLTKRASHFLFGLAYLDGETPSVVMVRGAWDNVKAAAWHIEDGKLTLDWLHETENKEDVNSVWGAMNHNMSCVDIDFDGKDEIISGPMAIDHDGSEMYAVKAKDASDTDVKLAHGDAFDVAKMDPDYSGYLTWACHETAGVPANIELHDARTGQVNWGYSKNKDCGRSRAADIDPNYRGFEVWGSTGTTPANIDGTEIADSYNIFKYRLPDGTFEKNAETGKDAEATLPMNFKAYWDGDLLSEFLDGTRVSKWNWEEKSVDVIFDAPDCASNSGTKAVPCVCADLFGDWREEIVWKNAGETELRVYSTAIPTRYKLPTLMHDPYYRAQISMQNNHYNQPANLSYYLGAETTEIPIPEIYTLDASGNKKSNPDLNGKHGSYKIASGGAVSSVELLIGSPNAYVGADMVKIDADDDKVVPTIVNDRTLVPVRFVSESFGLDVSYDDASKTVTLTDSAYDIKMVIGSREYSVNGETLKLDVSAEVINDRTMIPLRAMAEAIGKRVYYEDGYIYIGDGEFTKNSSVKDISEQLKSGKKPAAAPKPTAEPTPEPTATPDPYAAMTYTEEKDSDGTVWKTYINEDYESYSLGDAAGWAGTKPAPLDNIGVVNGSDGKAMGISGSSKGNRNAIYRLPGGLSGRVKLEFDWDPGECTGGSSYGELRLAGSDNKVFLAFKTSKGAEMQYSFGGAISNGALETAPWQNVGMSVNQAKGYHIKVTADFGAKTADFIVSRGSSDNKGSVTFTDASDFGAIEALAVRNEKNFEWSTVIDNLKISQAE